MRIVLVHPPDDCDGYDDSFDYVGCFLAPLWAVCLGTYIKNKIPDIKINILDGEILDLSEIIAMMRLIQPDVVGISPKHVNYNNSLRIAREAKRYGARIVMGGHYAAGVASEILVNRGPGSNDYCVDAVIRQDGEEAFYKWISGVSPEEIKNLVYWKNNEVIINEIELLDLNKLPIPDWNLVGLESYFEIHHDKWPNLTFKRKIYMCSGKGCGWRATPNRGCIFCSKMYKELRIRSPESVVEEIDYLVKNFKVDFIWDVSDDFLEDQTWFKNFYGLYKDYKQKPMICIYSRADRITKDIAEKLKELRICEVLLGLESGDPNSLKTMNKGVTADVNRKALQFLESYKITTIGSFIFGVPEENPDSLANSLMLIQELNKVKKNIFLSQVFEPLPNSPAFDMLNENINGKYKNRDLYDRNEIIQDWIKTFCNVSLSEILAARRKLQMHPHYLAMDTR